MWNNTQSSSHRFQLRLTLLLVLVAFCDAHSPASAPWSLATATQAEEPTKAGAAIAYGKLPRCEG